MSRWIPFSANCRYSSTSRISGTAETVPDLRAWALYGGPRATRKATMGRTFLRGRDVGPVYRLFGLRHRLPVRRPRVRRHRRTLQTVPRAGRRWARQLHPRPEGMHAVHPGLPPLSDLGTRDRGEAVRPDADRRGGRGHLAPDRPGPGRRPRSTGNGPGRWP